MKSSAIDFRILTDADLSLIEGWLAQPHVRRWWSPPDEALAEIKQIAGDPAFECFIVGLDGREVGYLQSYDPHVWSDHPFADRPRGSCGLDMFIGEPDMVGQGYGTRIVQAFVARLFAAGVPEALIDPHPDNAAAIKAYAKAGFVAYGESDTEWGRVLLMRKANPAFSGNHAT